MTLIEEDHAWVAGGKMSLTELSQSWLAFRELSARSLVNLGFEGREIRRAIRAGWSLGFRHRTQARRYQEHMTGDPYDFLQGYEWGVDVYAHPGHGSMLHPRDFGAHLVDRTRGTWAIPLATDPRVAKAVQRLRVRAQDARRRLLPTLKISPFILPNPWHALVWEYGISNGQVWKKKTLFLGTGPSLPVERVVDSYAEGGPIWGDVVFMNEVQPVVRWENVFRPEQTLQEARKVLAAMRESQDESVTTITHDVRTCPHCAEEILAAATLCKHCRSDLSPV